MNKTINQLNLELTECHKQSLKTDTILKRLDLKPENYALSELYCNIAFEYLMLEQSSLPQPF
jgi:hypothetical protein